MTKLPTSRRLALTSLVTLSVGCTDFVHFDPAPEASALRELIAEEKARANADVAIVLGCPASDDGTLSPCQACRVRTVVDAYLRGEVRYVIVSGAAVWSPFVEAEVLARAVEAGGVPASAILKEPRALTTWMNLRYSQRLMAEHGLATALIVSTKNHLPRARRFAEWYGIRAHYRACDLDLPPGSVE